MARREGGAERSRAYRENFAAKHGGVTFNAAGRMARALGLKPGARSEALQAVSSTEKGARLLSYTGDDARRLALRDDALKAAQLRSREVQAVSGLQRGEHGSRVDRAAIADAERRYDLPAGSLRRDFTDAELQGGTDAPIIMRVIGTDGVHLVPVTGADDRSLVARHHWAIGRALQGDPRALRRFEGVEVAGHQLATDLTLLQALYEIGMLDSGPYLEART